MMPSPLGFGHVSNHPRRILIVIITLPWTFSGSSPSKCQTTHFKLLKMWIGSFIPWSKPLVCWNVFLRDIELPLRHTVRPLNLTHNHAYTFLLLFFNPCFFTFFWIFDTLNALAADLSNVALQHRHSITSFSSFCFFDRKPTNDSPASGKIDSSYFSNSSKACLTSSSNRWVFTFDVPIEAPIIMICMGST